MELLNKKFRNLPYLSTMIKQKNYSRSYHKSTWGHIFIVDPPNPTIVLSFDDRGRLNKNFKIKAQRRDLKVLYEKIIKKDQEKQLSSSDSTADVSQNLSESLKSTEKEKPSDQVTPKESSQKKSRPIPQNMNLPKQNFPPAYFLNPIYRQPQFLYPNPQMMQPNPPMQALNSTMFYSQPPFSNQMIPVNTQPPNIHQPPQPIVQNMEIPSSISLNNNSSTKISLTPEQTTEILQTNISFSTEENTDAPPPPQAISIAPSSLSQDDQSTNQFSISIVPSEFSLIKALNEEVLLSGAPFISQIPSDQITIQNPDIQMNGLNNEFSLIRALNTEVPSSQSIFKKFSENQEEKETPSLLSSSFNIL